MVQSEHRLLIGSVHHISLLSPQSVQPHIYAPDLFKILRCRSLTYVDVHLFFLCYSVEQFFQTRGTLTSN